MLARTKQIVTNKAWANGWHKYFLHDSLHKKHQIMCILYSTLNEVKRIQTRTPKII